MVDHGVDGLLQFQNFSLSAAFDFLTEVSMSDGGGDGGDFAHLIGEVLGHDVDIFREFFPDAVDAGDLRLAAEDTFRADLAGDTGHFTTKDL